MRERLGEVWLGEARAAVKNFFAPLLKLGAPEKARWEDLTSKQQEKSDPERFWDEQPECGCNVREAPGGAEGRAALSKEEEREVVSELRYLQFCFKQNDEKVPERELARMFGPELETFRERERAEKARFELDPGDYDWERFWKEEADHNRELGKEQEGLERFWKEEADRERE